MDFLGSFPIERFFFGGSSWLWFVTGSKRDDVEVMAWSTKALAGLTMVCNSIVWAGVTTLARSFSWLFPVTTGLTSNGAQLDNVRVL